MAKSIKRYEFVIRKGDEIVFEEVSDNPDFLKTKIINLYYEDNFETLINKFDISLLASSNITKEILLDTLNNIYSQEEQEKYGVVGIEIELIED